MDVVAGRYRLQRRIGTGAMGVVWQAFDERLGRVVALKQLVLAPGLTGPEAEEARRRAEREGRIAARLHHPNVITVYDVVVHDGQPALVMEYLPSRSLAEVIADRGRLAPPEVARIGAQAAAGLAAAHAAGIVHRDVKPGNILLGENGTVKITDFGISRAVGDGRVTRTGLLAGTPAYLSPEAARGAEPGPQSDVFSLGATLYAAVEGRPPFGAENTIALLHTVAAGRISPPRYAGPITPALLSLLQVEPAARPPMVQVNQALQAVADGRVPAAPTQAMTRPDPQPTRFDSAPLAAPVTQAPRGVDRRMAYAALALIATVVLGVLLVNALTGPDGGGETPGAGPSAATPGPSSTSPTAAAEPAAMQRAVEEYYALLPDDTDTAWTRLGPGLQARGQDSYEKFWKEVEDLEIVSAPRAEGESVLVGLEFTVEKRGRFRETHELGMLARDGTWLINSDRVVSSERIGGQGDDDDN